MWAKIFLYIFGLLWLISSGLMIFSPEILRKICRVSFKIPIWIWGIISIGIAFLFWYAAPTSLSPCLVKAMALISIWKGLFLLLAPASDCQKTIDWSLSLSKTAYRVWGILLLPIAIYFLLRIG